MSADGISGLVGENRHRALRIQRSESAEQSNSHQKKDLANDREPGAVKYHILIPQIVELKIDRSSSSDKYLRAAGWWKGNPAHLVSSENAAFPDRSLNAVHMKFLPDW